MVAQEAVVKKKTIIMETEILSIVNKEIGV